MAEPLVITISHRLGRAEAKRRIAAGLDQIRAAVRPYVGTLDLAWDGDRLLFHVSALRQRIEGVMEVEEAQVRIAIMAPLLLRLIVGRFAGRIRNEGATLLDKPKSEA
ncbi:MAG TPA: polyhydroxyalkanoic acid system family protein [Stellaceae bacterium]|nr:polyhydroxyalkanoic acid system family protein [Stellaceae bacterium]